MGGMNRSPDLWPLSGNGAQFTHYKGLISGPVSNEFATAAFRMGHSLVQGTGQTFDNKGKLIPYKMKDAFNNLVQLSFDPTFKDNTIRGLVSRRLLKLYKTYSIYDLLYYHFIFYKFLLFLFFF